MKIFVNREPVSGPWGGGNNFVKAFHDIATTKGHVVTSQLSQDVDVILVIDPRPENGCIGVNEILAAKQALPKVKIVQRINECDARKNTEHMDHLLLQCSQFNDFTVFVSQWMQQYFVQKGWLCKRTTHIHNGVNKKIFRALSVKDKLPAKKPRVVAHHWSNNLLKGFDAYEFLDYLAGKQKISFTYVGRHRNSFRHTKIVEPCVGQKLVDSLTSNDIYISASRFDPGPNHVLEALAVGLPTYAHIDGGGAVEFAGKAHTFSNLEDIEDIVSLKKHTKNEYNPMSWEKCIQNYLQLFANL